VEDPIEGKIKMRGPGAPVVGPKTGVEETVEKLNKRTAEEHGGQIPTIDTTSHFTEDNSAALAEHGDD